MEEGEGPGSFTYTSHTYVWPAPYLNIGIHILPADLTPDTLQLGTITRAAYHALATVEHGLEHDGCFVMIHYVPSTQNVHVTMLPVGEEEARTNIDTGLKSGRQGFSNLLEHVVEMIHSNRKTNGVFILYNAPDDLATPTKVAIVHEIGVVVPDLGEFMSAIAPGISQGQGQGQGQGLLGRL